MFNHVERVDRVELLHVSTRSTWLISLDFCSCCHRQILILATKNRRNRRMLNRVDRAELLHVSTCSTWLIILGKRVLQVPQRLSIDVTESSKYE